MAKDLMHDLIAKGFTAPSEVNTLPPIQDKTLIERVQKQKAEKNKSKTKQTKKTSTKKQEEEEEEIYDGDRDIVIYGNYIYTEENPKATLEEIRQKVVEEYNYAIFSKNRTVFSFDKETGILCLDVRYEKKG